MNILSVNSGHRVCVWLWLVTLTLVLGTLAPPASAAPMKDMRPSGAFRVLAREIKGDLQAGEYARAETRARLLYDRFGDSSNDIESSGAATQLGRVLREMGKIRRGRNAVATGVGAKGEASWGNPRPHHRQQISAG